MPSYPSRVKELPKIKLALGATLQGLGRLYLTGVIDKETTSITLPNDLQAAENNFKTALQDGYAFCIVDLDKLARVYEDEQTDHFNPGKAAEISNFIVSFGSPLLADKQSMELIKEEGLQEIRNAFEVAQKKASKQ